MSFPHARRFEQVTTEIVGADVVLFVLDTMQYHNLSNGAYEIWLAADGSRPEVEIAELVFGNRSGDALQRVEQGLGALADAGLLDDADASRMSRRTVTKLAAATVLGGIGLPMVVSITAPDSASAHSHLPPSIDNGVTCPTDGSQVCFSHCCCTAGSTYGVCFSSCPEG